MLGSLTNTLSINFIVLNDGYRDLSLPSFVKSCFDYVLPMGSQSHMLSKKIFFC